MLSDTGFKANEKQKIYFNILTLLHWFKDKIQYFDEHSNVNSDIETPVRGPRRIWEDSVRMDLKEIDVIARNWVSFL